LCVFVCLLYFYVCSRSKQNKMTPRKNYFRGPFVHIYRDTEQNDPPKKLFPWSFRPHTEREVRVCVDVGCAFVLCVFIVFVCVVCLHISLRANRSTQNKYWPPEKNYFRGPFVHIQRRVFVCVVCGCAFVFLCVSVKNYFRGPFVHIQRVFVCVVCGFAFVCMLEKKIISVILSSTHSTQKKTKQNQEGKYRTKQFTK